MTGNYLFYTHKQCNPRSEQLVKSLVMGVKKIIKLCSTSHIHFQEPNTAGYMHNKYFHDPQFFHSQISKEFRDILKYPCYRCQQFAENRFPHQLFLNIQLANPYIFIAYFCRARFFLLLAALRRLANKQTFFSVENNFHQLAQMEFVIQDNELSLQLT